MTNGTAALLNIAILGFTIAVISPLIKGFSFMKSGSKSGFNFLK